MTYPALLSSLLVLLAPQDPSKAIVDALASKDAKVRMDAVAKAADSTDAKVVRAVAKCLRDSSAPIRLAAADALGRMDTDRAGAELERAAKAGQNKKDPLLFAAILRGIGRRGQESSIGLLADKPMSVVDYKSICARIYGLANIRSTASIEAILLLTRQAGRSRTEPTTFLEDTRTALFVLTGADNGSSKILWDNWWRDNKRDFRVAAERPWLPRSHRLRWEAFWGEPYETEQAAPKLAGAGGVTVREAAAALAGKDRDRQAAAVEALASATKEAALLALHKAARAPKVRADAELFAAVLRAIGGHGDPSSIAVLRESPFKVRTFPAVRARIYGLANIRDAGAVDALISMSQLATPNPGEGFVFIDDLHTALVVLTGLDFGASKIFWDQWWRDAKNGFVVAKERPRLPELHRLRWEAFWRDAYAPADNPSKTEPATMQIAGATAAIRGNDDAAALAAIAALGHDDSDAARAALLKAAKLPKIRKSESRLPAVFRAIGRHGDPASAEVLFDSLLSMYTYDAIRARIFGLANIRTKQSIDFLIRGAAMGSPPKGENFVFIEDWRTALVVLTGRDHGASKFLWTQWWNGVKKDFEVSPGRPEIAELHRVRWADFWGESYAR